MTSISENSKSAIDGLTKDELRYEIHLGAASRFQNEKFAYLKARLDALTDEEKSASGFNFGLFGVSIPIGRSVAILLILGLGVFFSWWNWNEIADRLGLSEPSAASVLEGEIVVLTQNWKLCDGSPGCTTTDIAIFAREAEQLLARATKLDGDDRRDLVAKATTILDETRKHVRPYPVDGKIPKKENIEDFKPTSNED